MKDNTSLLKNDKTEDIRMITDFKDELEKIKQKLAKDFTKYSELEKIKSRQKSTNNFMNNRAINYLKTDTNEDKTLFKRNKFFHKVPSFEEFKFKYGLVNNNQIQLKNNEPNNFINKDKEITNKKAYIKTINNKNSSQINDYSITNNNINQNNNYSSVHINTHNVNPLNYNISFRKKYINLSNEDDFSNFSFTNEINNQNKTFQDNSINEIPNIINNNINININNNSSLILNSKLDQQIKFINEKSENNRIEEEKTQKKIRQIENSLQLEERLTHNNREIRKNAIKELAEMCQKDFENSQDKQKMFEFFSPWIKYCLGETNSYVIPESLNFFVIFNTFFPDYLSISMKDFFDNVDRFISFGVYGINELCIKIFLMMFEDKKLHNITFNEFIKLLIKSSSIKVYKFIQELSLILLEKNILQENYIKILFEKIIIIYTKNAKNNDKKKILSKLITNIYNFIEDDYQEIKKNIKLDSYKELDSLFEKNIISNHKKKFITYSLYPRPIQTDIENINSYNNYFNYNIDLKDRLKTEKSNDDYKSLYDKKSISKSPDKKNNMSQININGEVNDLVSILPNEFFEYHFEVQFKNKMNILEKANELLNKIKLVKDKEKNLTDVYKTVNYSIEDSNILIHLEGIKLLENICRLINEYINKQRLKIVLETCFDKLKDKKNLVKSELFKLFNIVVEYNCLELNKFISFILHHCCNEKNDNIKLGLLEFVKSIFFQENLQIMKQIDNIKEKEYLYYSKKIVNIIENESLLLIKDLCSELLIIFKRKIFSTKIFYEIISNLPNHRKKLILNEEKIDIHDNNYKYNLKQIKSNYSLSSIKKGNRNKNIRSFSNIKTNNSSIKNNDSFSSNINIKKFKKINLYANKSPRINTIRPMSKKDSLKNKMNISFSNSPKTNNIIMKNKNNNINNDDYKIINKTKINEDQKYNNISNKKNNEKNKELESINIQKNNLLKSIDNINEDAIEKYSKIIIKDFISFIKKTSIQKNEDLNPHIELIFIIYEKIFQRIFYFMGKNQNKKQNMIKLKKLLDELMNYISKILIITPGIEQIKGTNKFDIIKLQKYLEIFKTFCFNEEKFYMNLLLNLYKLCNEKDKDEDFPRNFESKNSVIFFLNYIKKENTELKSNKILNVLKEFIAETNVLNLEEKNNLLEDIEINDNTINLNNEENILIKKKIIEKEKQELNSDSGDSDSEDNESYKNRNLKTKDNDKDKKKKFSSKLKKNDFTQIEESIKLFSNRLNNFSIKDINKKNNNYEKSPEESNKKERTNSLNKEKPEINHEGLKKNKSAFHIPISVLKNKLTLNNTKKLSLKLPNKIRLDNSFDKINKNDNNLDILKTDINDNNYTINNGINNNYNLLINKIIKILNNEIPEDGIFNTAVIDYAKLTNSQKILSINYIENQFQKYNNLFENLSLNILLKFYDFIISILSVQILKFPNEESLIVKLQNLILNLMSKRKLDDMFKIMLFLLKKYFPKNLNKKISDMMLVMLKLISYFLKELLKKSRNQKLNGKNIITEINYLFINTPPSSLTTKTPNCSLYQSIFILLKSITDEIAIHERNQFIMIINYLKEEQIICEEYMQYLIKLNSNLNK